MDDDLVAALRNDYTTAPISAREKVMIDYVVQLTRDATRITPEHHRLLAEAGYDDRARLQITLIAAWFNYINCVADALGVARGSVADVEGAESSKSAP